jgi:hypothetical protein
MPLAGKRHDGRREIGMAREEGLTYYPSRYDPPLGHAGFEARLSDAPRGRYFDVRRVVFPVEQGGALRRQTVEHPYRAVNPLHFIAGRIRLEAHNGDQLEIMTFGGEAAFAAETDLTVCRATSPAPFLPLDDNPESPFVLLVGELETALAQSRAGWGRDEYRHLDRLGEMAPMAVFVASMRTLEERLARLVRVEDDPATRRALHLVRQFHEQLAQAGEWPDAGGGLTDVL